MNHRGTVTLETDRLILRKFNYDDVYDIYNNWANDIDVVKYVTWDIHNTIEDTKIVLNKWVSSYSRDNYYRWAIVFKENNSVIGNIAINKEDSKIKMVNFGYSISKDYWNMGITTEALFRIIKFLFEEVGVNRIEGYHHIDNIASSKVMLKCGLTKEGVIREGALYDDTFCDIVLYSILRKDYMVM